MPITVTKLNSIKQASLTILLSSVLNNSAIAGESSDWRTDYKATVQAYYAQDYDQSTACAKTALDKVLAVNDRTEQTIALEQIVRQLRKLNGEYERRQNYSQQESVLRSILKAEQAKNDSSSSYLIKQDKKNLAICLVLEGKNEEAKKYLSNAQSSIAATSDAAPGWKKDLDLLTQVNKSDDRDNAYKYAQNAVDEALSVKNATEKEVALSQILQQLQMSKYKFLNDKDYPNEEKALKLMLKIQQEQEAQKSTDITMFSNYQSSATLKDLVTCLVMQGKDDEAATYDAQYKEATEKSMKQIKEFQKNFQEQLLKTQPPKDQPKI